MKIIVILLIICFSIQMICCENTAYLNAKESFNINARRNSLDGCAVTRFHTKDMAALHNIVDLKNIKEDVSNMYYISILETLYTCGDQFTKRTTLNVTQDDGWSLDVDPKIWASIELLSFSTFTPEAEKKNYFIINGQYQSGLVLLVMRIDYEKKIIQHVDHKIIELNQLNLKETKYPSEDEKTEIDMILLMDTGYRSSPRQAQTLILNIDDDIISTQLFISSTSVKTLNLKFNMKDWTLTSKKVDTLLPLFPNFEKYSSLIRPSSFVGKMVYFDNRIFLGLSVSSKEREYVSKSVGKNINDAQKNRFPILIEMEAANEAYDIKNANSINVEGTLRDMYVGSKDLAEQIIILTNTRQAEGSAQEISYPSKNNANIIVFGPQINETFAVVTQEELNDNFKPSNIGKEDYETAELKQITYYNGDTIVIGGTYFKSYAKPLERKACLTLLKFPISGEDGLKFQDKMGVQKNNGNDVERIIPSGTDEYSVFVSLMVDGETVVPDNYKESSASIPDKLTVWGIINQKQDETGKLIILIICIIAFIIIVLIMVVVFIVNAIFLTKQCYQTIRKRRSQSSQLGVDSPGEKTSLL